MRGARVAIQIPRHEAGGTRLTGLATPVEWWFRILYFEKKELFRLISFSYSILEMDEAKNRVYRVHIYKVKMRLVLSRFSVSSVPLFEARYS